MSEGYGPGDTALWVDCLAEDPERTAAAVREALLHHGGWPGAPGSVAYLFNEVGELTYPGARAEPLAALAWAAGAEDVVVTRSGAVAVRTDPCEIEAVRSRLAQRGLWPDTSAVLRRAAVVVPLEGPAAAGMRQLLEALRRIDGVQHIYTNAEVAGEVLASF